MNLVLHADYRQEGKSGAGKALRRKGLIPGILYSGDGSASLALQLSSVEVTSIVELLGVDRAPNTIVSLEISGTTTSVLICDLEYCKVSYAIQHIDLKPVNADRKVRVRVPLRAINADPDSCEGIRFGGVVKLNLSGVMCECLPNNIPGFLDVDVSGVYLGGCVYISKVLVPEGVKIVGVPSDCAVASVVKRGA